MRHKLLAALLITASATLHAESSPVRGLQGTLHGYLLLRSTDGKIIANGEVIQTLNKGMVTLRAVFHFRDGSLDEETTVYSQDSTFKLISDHHIQRGPSYPHPIDVSVDAATGQVTSRSVDKDGQEKVATDHLDFAPDVSSSILLILQLMQLPPGSSPAAFSLVAPSAKPRLIKATITPGEEVPIVAGTLRHKAVEYTIKIDLGGVAKVVAPIIGKAPTDIHVWIVPGEAPIYVREEGQLFEGGPIWSIEQTPPHLPAPKSH